MEAKCIGMNVVIHWDSKVLGTSDSGLMSGQLNEKN